MSTFAGAYPSKPSWQLQLDVVESSPDPVLNRSYVSWALYIYRGSSDTPWNNSGSGYSVSAPGGFGGTFGAFRFGGTGTGTSYAGTPVGGRVLIASGGAWVTHSPDGSGYVDVSASHAAASTLGTASLSGRLYLTTLKVAPSAPTGVAGARVSDTSVNVTWAQSSASNGQPTTNTVQRSINGGAFADVSTIAPATAVALDAAANQKIVYRVKGTNSVGDSAWSADSAPVYTTPGAPTGLVATKAGSDIGLVWTPNVAYAEHEHVLEHGVDVAGVVTWDGSPLATIVAGTSLYTHVAPNPAQRHVYRIRSRTTDVSALSSATTTSNVVQLLTAPAKPTVPALAAFADKAATFRLPWTHNAIDSSAQTKYQWRWSTNGGSSWTTGSKTTSANPYHDFAGSTWTANQAVTFQVRTKGAYDSGSDGDASYSPWSDSVTVTFKTKPVVTITTPANSSTYTDADLLVVLGFTQAESATFVNATIGLYDSTDELLEERVSTTLAGTAFSTRLLDGETYKVKATVTDSNGLTSAQVTSTFSVDYTEPVAAVVDVIYLEASGIAQIGITIPAAGGGLVDADTVSVDRVIDGVTTPVVVRWPAAPTLTFLDVTPTIHGTTLYRVTTYSDDGAASIVTDSIETAEDRWAFMSKGSVIVRFELAPGLEATPAVDSALVKAAGRRRPIALYATTGNLDVTGTGALAVDEGGSTPEEIEAFLLLPGQACYRDPSGRRVFGRVSGKIARENAELGAFTYSITETE